MRSAAFVAVCASALAGISVGQTPPASDLRPIARVSATEVLLDLVVLDKHGKPVKNLKPGDVEIDEDGVRQQATGFRYVPPPEARERSAPAAPAKAQAQATARPLREVNLVCLVFHNLDPVARIRAINVAREFLSNELPPDTYIGMFVLDDNLNPVYPFTNNRQELLQAVGNIFSLRPLDFLDASQAVLTANPTQMTITTVVNNATHTATTTARVSGGEISTRAVADAGVSTDIGASTMRGTGVTEARDFSHLSGMRETDRIQNMVTQFGALPGRKLVLLLSTGFRTTGDPDIFQAILNKANESHVTVYGIDVTGLTENSTSLAGDNALAQVAGVSRTQTAIGGSLSEAKEKSRQGDTMTDAVRTSDVQSSLRALAEGTGGFLVANTEEYRKPFQRIADDMETHYEVTYRPASTRYDGRLRTIQVKLSHADWHVESRTGYFAMPYLGDSPDLLPYETVGLALLDSKPLPHGFDVHSAAFNFRSDGQVRQGALVIELPGTALAAIPNAGRDKYFLRGQVLALIRDADGQVVDKFNLDTRYEIPEAKLAELRATPVVYTHALDLPPGKYTAETVVMDPAGRRAAADTVAFDNSRFVAGLGMSSLLLIRRVDQGAAGASGPLVFRGNRLVPFVENTLTPEIRPYAYFVVYPDKANSAKAKARIELRVDGKLLADQTADLPAPGKDGAVPMIIRAAVHIGRCELKITAIQGNETTSRDLVYTVTAK